MIDIVSIVFILVAIKDYQDGYVIASNLGVLSFVVCVCIRTGIKVKERLK